ncbi:MAG TPA: hypothetical protein PLA55_03880 [Candidatus Pacearchaeota archaeon]|nr:hypothetical protein [Candidatus Pacearchaeota archaeon]
MTEIDFKWSWIYESVIHNPTVKEEFNYEEYEKFINSFLDRVKPIWKNKEKEILSYIEEITELKWKNENIPMYLIKISSLFPISDPLTIPIQLESEDEIITLSKERFIDMLVHEIIHNFFIQNEEEIGDYFNFILEKYKDEEFDTSIHLLLHAIHKKIFLKYFDEERLNGEIEMNSYYPAYKRSWEIVNKVGEDNIIKEFKNYINGLPNEIM